MLRRRTLPAALAPRVDRHAGRGCGRHAAAAGAVSRLQGRRRQQAGALGPDRRVHEARRRQLRSRPLPRAWQDQQQQPVHRARDQRAGDAEEPRSLQAARAEAVLPGRRALRSGARRDLPAGEAGAARHLQHPRDRNRRVADGARAGAPAGDRRQPGGEEDSRQRDLRARAEPQPGRPDHGDRLVQPERRHASTRTARSRTCITRTSATTTTATCTCSRRRRASTRRGCCGTTGSPRCGSTSTRWAAAARASSSCRRPIRSTRTCTR